ncbi:hypothetical protein CERSUDRAFT_111075 [Gelatoporia subvermispora B]|uniref:F-box domain-containing protein n=1 Tax=Ceriporiopsis subvermispora (strain B) TaxID=914234 RepID=M2R7U5_CERS8|nr:hypothetical protein CERSUDRAFT_111075 [Gelatoporia subvermispora B]
MVSNSFESLPVELIADILSELDLGTLIIVSYLSHRLHAICSDSSLNPWRRPILRNLRELNGNYEPLLKHLCFRTTVPRQNWVEILSIARADYLCFEASLPNLKESEWEEAFRRRFLPGCMKYKKDTSWREAFLRVLFRTWHRTETSCTSDEAWTKYLVLSRRGTANLLEVASRGFDPIAVFNEHKFQDGLADLPTSIRRVVEFADVRIIALGVLHRPRSKLSVNDNARNFLHPPGVQRDGEALHNGDVHNFNTSQVSLDHMSEDIAIAPSYDRETFARPEERYRRLTHPLPAPSHFNYPLFTASGEDKRWLVNDHLEEGGLQWIGSMMITAQLVSSRWPPAHNEDFVVDIGRGHFASFTWADLDAIAPWLELTAKIDGPGLGH